MIEFLTSDELSPICHVGTMDISKKGDFSLEWNGLSVSYCPEDWKYIAKCGGPTWVLEDVSGKARFLDFHALDEKDLEKIRQWGVSRGWFEYDKHYRVYWYDEEWEDDTYFEFSSDEEEKAHREYESRKEDEYEGARFEELDRQIKPADALLRMSLVKIDPSMSDDVAVMLYAEQELGCEGVWWDDKLDRYALSAPRGVIFNSCLDRFSARTDD